eukprot:GHRR01002647.1.p1 GENE.GHRR01002647.1~~GHRR01002647.1.p1  ORF type:complete len:287 (+),score=98.33 GHRR01002647.1:87-947(+)
MHLSLLSATPALNASFQRLACARPGRSVRASFAQMSTHEVLAAGSAEPAPGPDRLRPLFITTWNCPYAQRTWIALSAKGLQYNPVFVDLMNKPEWFFKHNEYGRVPTLVWQDDGKETKSLYESLVCNEYINDLPGPALLPEDPTERARARLIIDQFAAKFGAAFGKLLLAAGPSETEPAAAQLNAALEWLEGQVSSEGPHFLGKDLSLVDAAIIPFFIRMRLMEQLGSYKAPQGLKKLGVWEAATMKHPAVQGSMQPPDNDKSYFNQLLVHTEEYIARRKAAAAAK